MNDSGGSVYWRLPENPHFDSSILANSGATYETVIKGMALFYDDLIEFAYKNADNWNLHPSIEKTIAMDFFKIKICKMFLIDGSKN